MKTTESVTRRNFIATTGALAGAMMVNPLSAAPTGWAADKKIEKAQQIYDAVGREKREPSTYEAMTRAYLAVEQREQAKGVVGEMLTRGYPSAVVNKVLELLGGGQEVATD